MKKTPDSTQEIRQDIPDLEFCAEYENIPTSGTAKHLGDTFASASYKKIAWPMSDEMQSHRASKGTEYANNFISSCRSDKIALIARCVKRIEDTKIAMERFRQDESLSEEHREKKIKHCMEIIANDEFTIKQTKEYLEAKRAKALEVYNQNSKTK